MILPGVSCEQSPPIPPGSWLPSLFALYHFASHDHSLQGGCPGAWHGQGSRGGLGPPRAIFSALRPQSLFQCLLAARNPTLS